MTADNDIQLHTKYRPTKFEEVYGQDHAVKPLRESVLMDGGPQAFAFVGPSGTGKTTLARICTNELGCSEIEEFDAAANSGIEDVKRLIERMQYFPAGGGSRGFIIDECHALSKQAWSSLLKSIEEPGPSNYWFFCTTEKAKLPRTIQTRCLTLTLKNVTVPNLKKLLREICEKELIELADPVILDVIAERADGSPRQALMNLSVARHSESLDESIESLTQSTTNPVAFDLARAISRNTWSLDKVLPMVKQMKDEPPEGIRQVVRAYFTTMALGNTATPYVFGVLSEFEKPCIEQNRITDIVLRLARINKWKK